MLPPYYGGMEVCIEDEEAFVIVIIIGQFPYFVELDPPLCSTYSNLFLFSIDIPGSFSSLTSVYMSIHYDS
jgi:hypothetical protein